MKQLVLIFVLIVFTVKIMAQFTTEELAIIRNGEANEPFKVLLTTNQDELNILRTKSVDVDSIKDNEDLRQLVYRLLATMNKEGGVGIAAAQVGVLKNVFLFARVDRSDTAAVSVAINPRIVSHADDTVCFEGDGCLSIPNTQANSERYPWVEVEYTDLSGKLIKERLEGYSREDNFVAIIFQHEYDHLQGILFTDRPWNLE